MKTEKEKQINWLKNKIKKDEMELEKKKLDFINLIKKHKKEEILPVEKKYSLWQRIKMVLKQF